jgi:hypothetical protein
MKNFFCHFKALLAIPAFLLSIHSANSQATVTGSLGFPIGVALNGIAYGNSVYVAVGAAGYIVKSTNGTAWTVEKTVSFLNTTYSRIVFGNGMFVAISQDGKIVTSTDGSNWTSQTSGTSVFLNDIVYAAGKFIIIGRTNTTLTSTDGISWALQNIGTASTDEALSITYANSKFVVGVRDASPGSRSYYSTTGAAGTWSNAAIGVPGQTLNKLVCLNNKYYALTGAKIYTSSDGIAWTEYVNTRLTTSAGNQVFHGFYDGTKYYFVGNCAEHSYAGVFTSTDGVTFTLQPQKTALTTQFSAYLNGRYFILGNEGLISSSDGINWSYPAGTYNAIATNGTRYVAVGQTNGNEAVIFTSTDWNTWTNSISFVIKPLNGITYGNSKFVAVGSTDASGFGTIATSADGLSWTVSNSGVADILKAVAYGVVAGNSRYVAVGNLGRIIYSANGTAWTSVESGATFNYYAVAFVNNYFVAVGGPTSLSGAAKVKYSADGITWTDVSPSIAISGHFHSIAYGAGKYVLVGRDNTAGSQKFISVTSTNITSNSAYSAVATVAATADGDLGTVGVGGVSYNNSKFCAISNAKTTPFAAYVLTSSDGLSWTTTNANNPGRLRGIIPVGTGFKVIGSTDTRLGVSVGVTLPLHLIDFSARNNNSNVLLLWKTSNEQNTSRFEIERSADGITFDKIGEVVANNTTAYNNYTYTDASAGSDVKYYRLKMIDIDGRSTYSPVLRIGAAANKSVVSLYPNPASDYVTVSLPQNQAGIISLFNNEGKQVLQKATASNTELIRVNELPAGIYIIQVKQGGKTFTEKLVKK